MQHSDYIPWQLCFTLLDESYVTSVIQVFLAQLNVYLDLVQR